MFKEQTFSSWATISFFPRMRMRAENQKPFSFIHHSLCWKTPKVHSLTFKTSFLFWAGQGVHSPSFNPGESIYLTKARLRQQNAKTEIRTW